MMGTLQRASSIGQMLETAVITKDTPQPLLAVIAQEGAELELGLELRVGQRRGDG